MIDFFTAPTLNGHKVSCTLEALEIPYETHFVNISDGEQHKPAFRALNPNGRMPVILDGYQNESRRLFEVLEGQLSDNEWLAGDFSIADVANWCWVRTYKWSGISINGLDNLQRWLDAVGVQPGMAAGVAVPFDISSLLGDEKAAEEFAANARKTLQP